MTARTPEEKTAAQNAVNEATTGARWEDFLAWSDKRVREAVVSHPHIPESHLESLTGAAYGYAVTPDYPCGDRDEILDRMLDQRTS
jgi:hypothetical protein